MNKYVFNAPRIFFEKLDLFSFESSSCIAWLYNAHELDSFTNSFAGFVNKFISKRLFILDDGYYPISSNQKIKHIQRALGGVGLPELKKFLTNKNDLIAKDGSIIYLDELVINEKIEINTVKKIIDKIHNGFSIDIIVSNNANDSLSIRGMLMGEKSVNNLDGFRVFFGDLISGERFALAVYLNDSDSSLKDEKDIDNNDSVADYITEKVVHFYPIKFDKKMDYFMERKSC